MVSRFVRAEMWRRRPGGLRLPQFRALAFINADPACSPSQLAEYLLLSRPAITRLLDELEKQRLVKRRPAETDRRRLNLSLTAKGQSLLDAYFTDARALLAERLAPLTPEERATVTSAMALVLPRFTTTPVRPQPGEEEK